MGRDRGHRCRRYPMGRLCPLTSTSTTVLRSSLAMAAIARDVKCSDGMSFNRMKQERGSTCRAAGAGGRRGNAGTSPPPGRPCTSGSGDRLENRHSMPGARFSFAVFLCGPAVTSVEVDRRHGIRIADVSAGPGWLAVLWTPDDPAVVRAYTADGRQSFVWTSPNEAA